MPTKIEIMTELERRGELPPEKAAILNELRRRGEIPGISRQVDPKESPGIKPFLAALLSSSTGGLIDRMAARKVAGDKTRGLIDQGMPVDQIDINKLESEAFQKIKQGKSRLREESPIQSVLGTGAGLFTPFGAPMKIFKVASKVPARVKDVPFLRKLLAGGSFRRGATTGGLGNVALGQLGAGPEEDRLKRAAIDLPVGAAIGGSFEKVGSKIIEKIEKSRAQGETQRLMQQLEERFKSIEDPALRRQAINESLQELQSGGKEIITEAGEKVKSGITDELNTASEKIANFNQEFLRGDKTPAQVKNAKAFLQDFFIDHGFMNKKGQWLDEFGKVTDRPTPRFGAGRTTEQQQRFLFDRFEQFKRNPKVSELSDIRKTTQEVAFKGPDPLFGKQGQVIVKGLSRSIRQDEEAAVRELFGENALQDFLSRKEAFAKPASETREIAKKIGLMNDAGEFIIKFDPEKLLGRILKLDAGDFEKLKPLLERRGLLPELSKAKGAQDVIGSISPLTKPGVTQQVGFKLAKDPKFFAQFEKAKKLLPPETTQQIKGDFMDTLISRTKGDPFALSSKFDEIGQTALKSLFNEQELMLINVLKIQAQKAGPKTGVAKVIAQSVLGRKLAGRGAMIPNQLIIDNLLKLSPKFIVNMLESSAKKVLTPEAKILGSRAISETSEALGF